MNIAEPDLQVAARREEIVRLEELTARARAQTAFSSAVIARVVSDLESRRRALVASIEAEMPSLRARCAELCAREASYARRAEEIGFQIDEIALRAAIGEIEGGGEGVLQAERAQADHALSEARSERLYLEDLLSRCAPRRDDPAPAPPDEDIEILNALSSHIAVAMETARAARLEVEVQSERSRRELEREQRRQEASERVAQERQKREQQTAAQRSEMERQRQDAVAFAEARRRAVREKEELCRIERERYGKSISC